MSNKSDIYSSDWCEIVFEDRNKDYGAYELRKKYAKNATTAILVAIAFSVVSITTPLIYSYLSDAVGKLEKKKIVEDITLAEAPPLDKDEPPPPPVEPPPPPLKTTIKFTPPVIVEETEEPPPTQEELKEVVIATETVQGDDSGVDLSLVETPEVTGDDTKVYTIVEQMPSFPGGEGALRSELLKRYLPGT
jgi:periplasmic protein TonB